MMQSDQPRFLCVSFHCPTRSTLAERLCQPACCWSPASVLAGAVTLHVESCTLTSFFSAFFLWKPRILQTKPSSSFHPIHLSYNFPYSRAVRSVVFCTFVGTHTDII